VAKNAMANIVRGGASAMAALAIPHFLAQRLDHDQFAAWALMLQIAAYANYFDFGLQTAVARYLAQAIEEGNTARRDRLAGTVFGLLALAGSVAFVMLAVIIWQLPHLFHSIPAHSVANLRAGLIVMAACAAIGLPMSVFTGILIGLHRNEFPALAIGGSRLIGAVAVIVAAHWTQSLLVLGLCLGCANLLGALIQYIFVRRLLPDMKVHFGLFNSAMARELIGYCSTLTVWSFAMLLVSGLDVTIVGYFNFSAVGYYALAATLVSFVVGLSNSVMMAMLTPVAALQTRGEYHRIKELILRSAQLNTYACGGLTIASFLYGPLLLRIWVGSVYAAQALPILEILLAAQTIRLIGSGYSVVLVALGRQRVGLIPAMIEGVLNLILSIMGMLILGASGVAWATLMAAAIAATILIVFVMPRVREIQFGRIHYLQVAILRPILAFSPAIMWILARAWYVDVMRPNALWIQIPQIAAVLAATFMVFIGIRREVGRISSSART
jgi:O-antigen/teichoic acid export membrane protein